MDAEAIARLLDAETNDERDAAELVRRYIRRDGNKPIWTGSEFERFGIDDGAANEITHADLLALSLLGVPINGPAVLEITSLTASAEIHQWLAGIPQDCDPSAEAGRRQLTEKTSEANEMWHRLVAVPGFGPTYAGKLLARKRPKLLPVYDSVIGALIGSRSPWWKGVAAFYAVRDRVDRLERIRESAGAAEHLSTLRTLDVVLWMRHRGPTAG